MNAQTLFQQIQLKKSMLCVGLDPDTDRIPAHLHEQEDPVHEFCREIIQTTAKYAVAYKLNIAFFEANGLKGWETLRKVLADLPEDCLLIADAKRGDIGNTSRMYARTFFDTYPFDAITIAPYMGEDSVTPFLDFEDKWVFLLGITSNPGGLDFQMLEAEGKPLWQHVMAKSQRWAQDAPGNLGFVAGATRAEYFTEIRKIAPEAFLLVPGIGAQGGDLMEVCRLGLNSQAGLLINSSRGIIYASSGLDFAEAAGEAAAALQRQMEVALMDAKLL